MAKKKDERASQDEISKKNAKERLEKALKNRKK
jgi:hypothetical protein